MKRILNITLLIYFLFIAFTAAQTKAVKDTFLIRLENHYKLSELNIIPFTESVSINKKYLSKEEYTVDYSSGTIRLNSLTNISLLDTLIVTYNSIIVKLKKEYRHRVMEIRYDDKLLDTIRQSRIFNKPLTSESIFGNDLQKSGALIRGFTVGTNRDFTLNSGLRLQLSGKLSDDISLIAALSDENTPIQPEGNTERLNELDKVFIELRHKNAVGTFGDYELNLRETEFGQLTRKLQGLKGEFQFGNTNGMVAVAGSKGKFTTNQFQGQDGNQGPYRLFGINNEREIILIAGSEKVFIDGVQMRRGENNDYVIDYSNAEVTFTPKRLITSSSRISIDFEYSDEKYKRNFFAATFNSKLMDEKLSIGIDYFREGDDEDSPIDFTLSDTEKGILQDAGNNRDAATVSGVQIAPLDSLGKTQGLYAKVDTTINNSQFTFYKYLPGDPSAFYNISFTFLGNGNGDYVKESLGRYKFVGTNLGDYRPVIYLPMPQLKQIGNFSLDYKINSAFNISAELSASSFDRNKLSSKDDLNNFGYARKLIVNLDPIDMEVAGISLGKFGVNFKDRFIQSRYSSIDRIDAVEFNRYYNNTCAGGDQSLRELELKFLPSSQIQINTKYGALKQGDSFSSNRYLADLKIDIPKTLNTFYNIDYVSSSNSLVYSKWLRQNGTLNVVYKNFSAGLDYLMEDKKEKYGTSNSLLSSSLRYEELSPFIQYGGESSLTAKAGFGIRQESFPINGLMEEQSNALTHQYQINYRGIREFTTSLNVTLRNKKYTDEFKLLGMTDNETVLLLSQSRFNFWNNFISGDLYYQAATEQTARLEKVFVKVEKGNGNYIYLGDLNNNGIPEENEFQLTMYDGDFILVTVPTDKMYPVIDLKLNTRWKIDFRQFIKGDDLISSVLRPISTETFWRVDENSKDPETKNIYLLDFSKFLSGTNTLRGTQIFQQDVNLFQNNRDLSFRFRFNQRRTLNQYSGGVETGFLNERSVRIYFKMIEEISNQTDYTNKIDNMDSPVTSGRARKISENNLASDFSYRPIRDLEIGFKVEAARSIDSYNPKQVTIDLNSITLRVNYSFENFGRLRIETERTELNTSSSGYNIPFEILKGNIIGKNYFWRVFFDYRISSFIQTSVSYDARLQGANKVINTIRAEARAIF